MIMTSKPPFRFVEYADASAHIFCARLSMEIHSREKLLRGLYDVLHLPGYFGLNWDALHECLRDFSWISERRIVLIHDRLPKISEDQLKIYLAILSDAVLSWKAGEEHEFEVVFPETDRAKIEELLSE
jgi:hypothetical protein